MCASEFAGSMLVTLDFFIFQIPQLGYAGGVLAHIPRPEDGICNVFVVL
jgi:hypothetical protein